MNSRVAGQFRIARDCALEPPVGTLMNLPLRQLEALLFPESQMDESRAAGQGTLVIAWPRYSALK